MTMTSILSEEIAKIYWNKIQKLHGIPQTVFSNRGPQFVLQFMEDLMKAIGTKQMLSTAYHPQTDGQTE